MKKHSPRKLKLNVPQQKTAISDYLSASGTFRDGDLLLNKDGLRVISHDTPSSSAVTPPQDTTFTLEDLETVRVIGKGSGGVVQLVRHKWTGQFFALKAIQMNIQEDVRKQIVRELKIHQASQYPYVIYWYHSFFINGVISIVLEYMDGGSLADVLRDFRRVPEAHLAAICKQVLKGLAYLHEERHVIHRDIKPSNLLLNHKGEVKISDFGVSVILSNSLAPRDTFVGTYIYMSPERISGGTYGFESDIWSLGLVILECAIGRFPYFAPGQEEGWPSVFELVHTVVEQPAPSAPPDEFSPEFCSFISGCIQKDSKDRLSASQLLNHPFIVKYESQGANANLLATFIQHWSPIA